MAPYGVASSKSSRPMRSREDGLGIPLAHQCLTKLLSMSMIFSSPGPGLEKYPQLTASPAGQIFADRAQKSDRGRQLHMDSGQVERYSQLARQIVSPHHCSKILDEIQAERTSYDATIMCRPFVCQYG